VRVADPTEETDEPEGPSPEDLDARHRFKHSRQEWTLRKWPTEKQDQHRALLLVAMQDPHSNPGPQSACDGRNLTIAARAMGIAKSTIKTWRSRLEWDGRIAYHGPDGQALAIELYRHLYLEQFGTQELPHVAPVCSLPMTTVSAETLDTEPTSLQDQALKLVRGLIPPPAPEQEQRKVQAAVDRRRSSARQQNDAITAVAVNLLGVMSDAVRARLDPKWAEAHPHVEPIPVPRASDLAHLMEVLQLLERQREILEHPEIAAAQAGPGALVDSVRVRIAKETGSDVLEAVAADCREVLQMVAGLRGREVTIEQLQAEQQGDTSPQGVMA
jgi:hypothetical protein